MVGSPYLHEQPSGLGVMPRGIHQVCLTQLLSNMIWQLCLSKEGETMGTNKKNEGGNDRRTGEYFIYYIVFNVPLNPPKPSI